MTYNRVNLLSTIVLVLSIRACLANDAGVRSVDPGKKPEGTGEVGHDQREWAQALKSYQRDAAANPKSALALAKLAYAESRLHMPDSTAHFQRAVELAPTDLQVWTFWARALKENHDFKGEVECRTQQLKKLPQTEAMNHLRSDCLNRRADAYLRLHQNELAYQDLDKAIEISPKYSHPWMERAVVRTVHRKDFKGAMSDINKAIELEPREALFYHHRSNINWAFGHKDDAFTDLQTACKLAPDDLETRTSFENLKLVMDRSPDAQAAIRDCTAELATRPDSPDVFWRRANAYLHLSDYGKAANDLEKGLSLSPESIDLVRANAIFIACHDYSTGLRLINQAIASRPKYVPALLTRAEIQSAAKHFGEAEADVNSAVKLTPNDPTVWFSGSNVYAAEGRNQLALGDVEHALTLRPHDPGYLLQRANLLYLLGKKSEAVAAYRVAAASQPGNAECHILYLKARYDFFRQGDPNELKKLLDEAIRKNPKAPQYYFWRADLLELLHDYRGAASDIEQGFQIDGSNIDYLLGHMNTFINNHQDELAMQVLSKEIEMHPNSAALYCVRAKINLRGKKIDAAKQDIATALKIDPKIKDAFKMRGDMKRELLDYEGALADYGECLKNDPNDSQARLARALVYKEIGRNEEARSDFQYVKAHFPALAAEANISLAYCEYALHNYAAAEAAYRQCEKSGDRGFRYRALLELGRMFQQQKRYKDAIEVYLQITRERADTSLYERIANCYVELKQWDKVIANMSLAIAGEPHDSGFYCERAQAYMQMHNYKNAIADYTTAIKYGREKTPRYLRMRADAYDLAGQAELANKDRQDAASIIKDLMNYR